MEKYKLTKTIRFKLESVKTITLDKIVENLTVKNDVDLAGLINEGFELVKLFKQFIYFDDKKTKLKKTVTVHFRWLRQYTRESYYNWKDNKISNEKWYNINDVPFLPKIFSLFFEEWEKTIEEINTTNNLPEDLRTRKANIGLNIRKLGVRKMFPFVEDFLKESKEKNTDEILAQLISCSERFNTQLRNCEQWALPEQSSGIELCLASFNYYTVNKKPKDYERQKDDINNQINKPFPFANNQKQLLKQLDLNYLLKTPMSEAYSEFKKIKTLQKKAFTQAVEQGVTNDVVERKFPLFYGNPEALIKYNELTKSIEKLAREKNGLDKDSGSAKKLEDNIGQLKQLRGKLFFDGHGKPLNENNNKIRFQKYLEYCRIYKVVAQKYGQLNARLKGINKEEVDSLRLQFWALLLENDNQHQLALIPRKHMQQAYQIISKWQIQQDGSAAICYFESLTYRSLHKLCFGINGNTFRDEIKAELKQKREWNYSERDFGEHIFKKNDGTKDEQSLICFYKRVLQTDFVKNNMVLPKNIYSDVFDANFECFQDFQIALEKCCYVRYKKVSGEHIDNFLNQNQAEVFNITSYDLCKKNRHNLKAHTRLWLDFWKNENEQQSYPLRLNPEIAIRWRKPKETRIKKYGKETVLYDPCKKNRYLYPQFTLVTTFTQNSLNPEINYAFQNIKQKGEAIIDFNIKINEHLKQEDNIWFFGIDTGIVELGTLCLMDKNKRLQLFPVIELKKDKIDFEKIGYFKDGTQKPYKAIKNLSYFLNPELYKRTFHDEKFEQTFDELFEKKEVSAIDLSVAKVINNHIVLNGDIISSLNLRILNAKRKIYQALISNPNAELIVDEFKIWIGEPSKENTPIFFGREIFNPIKSFEVIYKDIEEFYFQSASQKHSFEKEINNARASVVGNTIGVIRSLYAKYKGFIVLEDFRQAEIESKRQQFEGMIERPLEWAIYRKFQGLGLTPPVSELVSLRECEKFEFRRGTQKEYKTIKQFGILLLVNKEGTSLCCPYCPKKAYKNEKELKPDKDLKIFKCPHCNFHNHNNTFGLEDLDNNDKVAAYNIAKRGLEKLFPI